MKSLTLALTIGIVALTSALAPAQDEAPVPPPAADVLPNCTTCHVSDAPTADNAALRACPRPMEGDDQAAANEPDVVILDQLSEIYVPVVFPHKLHASMTDMGVGCSTCHHSNPPGRILRCAECHNGPSEPANLEKPSLKGAFHRQCLNCHREWDHKTDCTICHAKRLPGPLPEMSYDPTDIMGSLHPNIEAPSEFRYTPDDAESVMPVAFRHEEHVNVFGLRCVDCHRQQNCTTCHDPEHRPEHVRTDPHQDCIQCHETETNENCAYCHTVEPITGFDHLRVTGKPLAAYHTEVACRQCHPGQGRMAAPNPDCATCHAEDWTPAEFDHAVTGYPLDETHLGLDCVACHPNGMGRPRDCSVCHDDNRTTFK